MNGHQVFYLCGLYYKSHMTLVSKLSPATAMDTVALGLKLLL